MKKQLIRLTEADLYQIILETVEDLASNGDIPSETQEDAKADVQPDYCVDNFQLIGSLMNFQSDDDFYFVEIIKRKKDNPNDAFRYRQFITYYWIKSVDELNSLKDEIIDTCKQHNARAYIYMNPRSAKVVNDYAKVLMKRFAQKGRGYGKYRGHEIEFASGQHKDWDSRPISFIDIDSTDENVFTKVKEILNAYGITPMAEYKTPNGGLHILLPDKKARYLDWSMFDGGKKLGQYATVHFNVDSPSLLYSNIEPQGY